MMLGLFAMVKAIKRSMQHLSNHVRYRAHHENSRMNSLAKLGFEQVRRNPIVAVNLLVSDGTSCFMQQMFCYRSCSKHNGENITLLALYNSKQSSHIGQSSKTTVQFQQKMICSNYINKRIRF